MSFWDYLMVAFRLAAIIAKMKQEGLHGQIRTKIIAQTPDGAEHEFPFFTFTV